MAILNRYKDLLVLLHKHRNDFIYCESTIKKFTELIKELEDWEQEAYQQAQCDADCDRFQEELESDDDE